MILLSHAVGNQNVRQAALAFREAGLLGEFWTCLNWNADSSVGKLLPRRVRSQLARRSFPKSIESCVRTRSLLELIRLSTGLVSIDTVMRDLDKAVAARLRNRSGFDLVYAYEDGALSASRQAREKGIKTVYDLPIGYWRVAHQIYAEEQLREPAWAPTLTGASDSEEKLARKEEELLLADRVVVASSFTKSTITPYNSKVGVSVIPYGAPEAASQITENAEGKLRILFAGSLGQRKGISYLLKAVGSLGSRAVLTLLGRKTVASCAPLEAATRRHRWIPSLPHSEVLALMRQHDVLVLPSLFEGFGLVILEAMAQGLTVITTPHTAGPDLLAESIDGFVVPIRSAEAIAEKLELLLEDPARLQAMKAAALAKASHCRWEDYRIALARMAREVVENRSNHAAINR